MVMLVRSLAKSHGGVALATFDQGDDMDRFKNSLADEQKKTAKKTMGAGVCFALSVKFIVQNVNGMPPLGVDLERSLSTPYRLLTVPENTAIFTKYPAINNHRLPVTWSTILYQRYREMLSDWLRAQGFFYGPQEQINVGFGPGLDGGRLMASYANENRELMLQSHGWGLFGASDVGSGHAFLFHTGASGEWMFVDVNYGWFMFPDFSNMQNFLGEFWLGAGYKFNHARLVITVRRTIR